MDEGGYLVTERFSTTCRHNDQAITPGKDRIDNLLLPISKRLIAKDCA
jgi:hypothetical protein